MPTRDWVAQISDNRHTIAVDNLQANLLQGVSRTFALTIPQLPDALVPVVTNAYLLCRMVDTIEDEPALTPEQKSCFCNRFVAAIRGEYPAGLFSSTLAPLLSNSTLAAEHELICNAATVVQATHQFELEQQRAIERCITIMASGMMEFQQYRSHRGLDDIDALARYCYHVAGVVGEMLTQLFCHHSQQISRRRELMMPLAVSFGQGLQLTNIIKDLWDDYRRGACWLPRDIFDTVGFDLDELTLDCERERFSQGLERLIGFAHDKLDEAMEYVFLIPKHETGIRLFCLWAISMAFLTLRKIHKHPDYTSGNQVKITRRSVRATYITLRMTVHNNVVLKSLAQMAGGTLPRSSIDT